MTSREKQRQETRQRIYDTAMDLFTRKGFTRVSVDDICDKIGVSKGTFYYYFKSKDQVLLEEFLKIDKLNQEWIETLEKKHRSPSRILAEFAGMSFAHLNALGVKTLRIIYYSEIDPVIKKSALASSDRPLYAIIEKLIEEGREKGDMRRDLKVRNTAALWIRCYRGITYEWCLWNGGFDLIEAGEEFAKMFGDYLRSGTEAVRRR